MSEPMSDADLAAIRERAQIDRKFPTAEPSGWERHAAVDRKHLLAEVDRLQAAFDEADSFAKVNAMNYSDFLAMQQERDEARAELDRLRAKETETEWEYGPAFKSDPTVASALVSREVAEREVAGWNQARRRTLAREGRDIGESILVRRRKAGTWEPIEAGESDGE